jgi:hypothetical protein
LPPNVTNPGAQSSAPSSAVSLQVVASDPTSQPLTYSASGLPAGLSINTNSGLINCTIAAGAATGSPYAVTVNVTDGTTSVPVNFTWTVGAAVNLPPNVTNPGNRSNAVGNVISVQVVASDPEVQTLSYSATGLPTGLSINTNTGLISGTIAAGAATGSPYASSITVTDGTNPVNVNFTWTVAASSAPQVVSLQLVDIATNTPTTILTNGTVISLAAYPQGISVQANTFGTITQIQFNVNDIEWQLEGVAPYALDGDNNGDFDQWVVTPGVYTITAMPLNNLAGLRTVTITITN